MKKIKRGILETRGEILLVIRDSYDLLTFMQLVRKINTSHSAFTFHTSELIKLGLLKRVLVRTVRSPYRFGSKKEVLHLTEKGLEIAHIYEKFKERIPK